MAGRVFRGQEIMRPEKASQQCRMWMPKAEAACVLRKGHRGHCESGKSRYPGKRPVPAESLIRNINALLDPPRPVAGEDPAAAASESGRGAHSRAVSEKSHSTRKKQPSDTAEQPRRIPGLRTRERFGKLWGAVRKKAFEVRGRVLAVAASYKERLSAQPAETPPAETQPAKATTEERLAKTEEKQERQANDKSEEQPAATPDDAPVAEVEEQRAPTTTNEAERMLEDIKKRSASRAEEKNKMVAHAWEEYQKAAAELEERYQAKLKKIDEKYDKIGSGLKKEHENLIGLLKKPSA